MGRGPNDGLYRRIEKLWRERDTLRVEAAALRELLRRWATDHGCYCDVEEDESCLTCQTEATLNPKEQNDG
jgi:hypothetical protein